MDPFGEMRLSRARASVLLIVGAIIGALMITPGVAHVGQTIGHLTGHLDPRYAQAPAGHDVFALVNAGLGGGVPASAGPVAGVDRLDTGEYRVRFSQAFTTTNGEVFALVSARSVEGESCSWHYHGTSRRQLRVRCYSPAGAPDDANFTMVVFSRG
jgi:hypothetical protein